MSFVNQHYGNRFRAVAGDNRNWNRKCTFVLMVSRLLFHYQPLRRIAILRGRGVQVGVELGTFTVKVRVSNLPVFRRGTVTVLVNFRNSSSITRRIRVSISTNSNSRLTFSRSERSVNGRASTIVAVSVQFRPLNLFHPREPMVPIHPIRNFFSVNFSQHGELGHGVMTQVTTNVPRTIKHAKCVFVMIRVVALGTISATSNVVGEPPSLTFRTIPVHFVTRFLQILSFIFSHITSMVSSVFELSRGKIRHHVSVDYLAVRHPNNGSNFVIVSGGSDRNTGSRKRHRQRTTSSDRRSQTSHLRRGHLLSLYLLCVTVHGALCWL